MYQINAELSHDMKQRLIRQLAAVSDPPVRAQQLNETKAWNLTFASVLLPAQPCLTI